ncbi:hypothetical protein B0H14DRAFT_2653383 [Mycena olivaceomarginata]|nr:hypothetical protein B0H14DRAFT_2653383 [Mycena olivaceomarginata]
MMRSIPPNSHQQLSIHLPPSVASRYRGSLASRHRAPVALCYGLAPTQSQSIWNILRSMAERPTSREARGGPPSDKNGVDLLRNRGTAEMLGPFNGRVGAHFDHHGAPFFTISHARYIPNYAPGLTDQLFLRRDMRYGPDDPTLWPQQYSAHYCHLGAIPRKPPPPQDRAPDIMSPASHLHAGSANCARTSAICSKNLSISSSMNAKHTLQASCPPEVTPLLPQMAQVPRMENPDVEAGLPDNCIGVFTSDPAIAQQFHIARLPYWFIRPLSAFNNEIILSVVPLLDPTTMLVLDAALGYPSVPVGTDHDQRIRSLHLCTQNVPWYKNPFASPRSTVGTVDNKEARKKAKAAKAACGPNPAAQEERDKYTIFDSPFMPAVIDGWADALAKVDRSQPARYVKDLTAKDLYACLEPALLVSLTGPKSQVALHHYQLIHDALLYHLGDPDDAHWALPTQVWRDILQGKVSKQGKPGARTEARSASIEAVLGPALKACGIDKLSGFLADGDPIPLTTRNRSKELLWELAEINFRFELLALDARASGIQRPEECRECFLGGRLIRLDLVEGKQGFAAIASKDRLPYLQCLASLMVDW